jgi:hypothetical protein
LRIHLAQSVSKLGDGDSSSSIPRMIAAIGYLAAFTKTDSRWYFAAQTPC